VQADLEPVQGKPEQGKSVQADLEPVQADREPERDKPVQADLEPVQGKPEQGKSVQADLEPVQADVEQRKAPVLLARLYRSSSPDPEEGRADRKSVQADWEVGSAGHISDNSSQRVK
jgi:hypothetical protein